MYVYPRSVIGHRLPSPQGNSRWNTKPDSIIHGSMRTFPWDSVRYRGWNGWWQQP
jgi:hypothetical protein